MSWIWEGVGDAKRGWRGRGRRRREHNTQLWIFQSFYKLKTRGNGESLKNLWKTGKIAQMQQQKCLANIVGGLTKMGGNQWVPPKERNRMRTGPVLPDKLTSPSHCLSEKLTELYILKECINMKIPLKIMRSLKPTGSKYAAVAGVMTECIYF